MDTPFENSIKINDKNYNLPNLEQLAWQKLVNGSVKKKNGFRNMCVGTNGPKNDTSLRIVVNRKVVEAQKTIYFHTDNRSRKVYDLKKNNHITLLFYDPRQRTQIVVKAIATIDADPLYTTDRWRATSPKARLSYMAIEPPNTHSDFPNIGYDEQFLENEPSELVSNLYQKNFSIIACQVYELEFLYLDNSGNRKANFCYKNGILTSSTWVVP